MPSRISAVPPCRWSRPAAVRTSTARVEVRTAASLHAFAASARCRPGRMGQRERNGPANGRRWCRLATRPRRRRVVARFPRRGRIERRCRIRPQHRPRAKRRGFLQTTTAANTGIPQFQDNDPARVPRRHRLLGCRPGGRSRRFRGGALLILTTANGGRTWTRLDTAPAARPPQRRRICGQWHQCRRQRPEDAWIATGAGRVLHSSDGGRSWNVTRRRFHQASRPGSFQSHSAIAEPRVVVGGDYRNETAAVNNAALTRPTPAQPGAPRHVVSVATARSSHRCPRRKAHTVAAGPSGVDSVCDDGRTWTTVPAAGVDTVSFAPGPAAAGALAIMAAWQSSSSTIDQFCRPGPPLPSRLSFRSSTNSRRSPPSSPVARIDLPGTAKSSSSTTARVTARAPCSMGCRRWARR